jgi:hypothetical protein
MARPARADSSRLTPQCFSADHAFPSQPFRPDPTPQLLKRYLNDFKYLLKRVTHVFKVQPPTPRSIRWLFYEKHSNDQIFLFLRRRASP